MIYPQELEELIDYLSSVPGISERAAERAALGISELPKEKKSRLIYAISQLSQIKECSQCGLPAKGQLCSICSDPSRESDTVCVVEQPIDALSIERLGIYKGLYHVLGGLISPLEGIMPEDLRIDELLERISTKRLKKVIIALSPSVEGEATSKFIINKLQGRDIKILKIACGLPYGATLESADELTLRKAMENMKPVSGGSE